MAVTISQTPDNFSLSGNPVIFVFSSDQTAQDNFSYKVELYADGVLKETHFVFPEAGIYAHFNASDFAERYCVAPQIASTDIYDAENYIELLKVKVIENYGTPPADQASDEDTIVAYKGKQTKLDFINWTPSSYEFAASSLWLTLFPRTEKRFVELAKDYHFMYLTDSNTLDFTVDLYDSSDSLLASGSSGSAIRDVVSIITINNAVLLATYGHTQNNIDNTKYFEIYCDNGAVDSEKLKVYVDNDINGRCVSTSDKTIEFLSKVGSLETYRFTKRSQEGAKIKGQEFQEQFGYFDDSNAWDFNQGGLTDYVKTAERSLQVQTDFISEDEYNWLVKNLLESPLVYINESGTLVKCKVRTSKYEYKTNANDMVFNLKVDLVFDKDTSTVV